MERKEVEEVVMKVMTTRSAKKDSLKGIDLMQWNLFWKLRGWMMREDGYRCVCIGEIVDKVKRYAPKAIIRKRDEFVKAVEDLWSVTHGYTISSEDDLRDELEFELSYIYI